MLVRNGHSIILKTIMGRIPASVTHMSFGTAYGAGINSNDLFLRENMGFEVLRVPVQVAFDHLTSTTTIPKGEEFQLVYKGEIPTNRRIAFEEVGLWCGSSNLRYGDGGGVLISTVESSEHWLKKSYSVDAQGELTQLSLDVLTEQDFFTAIQFPYYDDLYMKLTQPRIGNTALPIEAYTNTYTNPPYYIYELPTNMNLSLYSPIDTVKMAVTWSPLLSDIGSYAGVSEYSFKVDLIFNFSSSNPQYASKPVTLTYDLTWGSSPTQQTDTYRILEAELGDLTDANRGTLNSIGIRVYDGDLVAGAEPEPGFSYVLIDGIRIDRAVNNNPLYGLVFYDYVVKRSTIDDVEYYTPIEKISGFDGHIEHRVRMFANATGQIAV